MIIRTVFILNFLITGCAVSQVAIRQDRSSSGTGDIMGMVYDEGSFFINPPFYLVLFNQNERFTKLVSEFSFSFDSIPTGSYTLALIDSIKNEGFVNTDTLYDISIQSDSISMVAIHFNDKDDHWQLVKAHKRDRNNTGNIEGRFNVEEYEEATGCYFKPEKGNYASITVKNKFLSFQAYTDSLGFFSMKNIPLGFYQANASKRISKDECLPNKARNYSKYSIHRAIGIFNILIIPIKTSIILFDEIIAKDAIQIDLLNLPMDSEPKSKWPHQFKN